MTDLLDDLAAEGRVDATFVRQYPYLQPLLPPMAVQQSMHERHVAAKAEVERLTAGGMTRHDATMAVIRAAKEE